MKFSAILAVISLAIGFAIGWIAKPAPPVSETQAAVTNDAPKISDRMEIAPSANSIEKSDRKTAPPVVAYSGNGTEGMTEEQQAQMEKAGKMMQEMMTKKRKSQFDTRIAKLVSQLNLNPEQEASLRKLAEENMASFNQQPGDFNPANPENQSVEKTLDDALAEILTDEQKEENEALKKRELENKIEATALKRLAKLSKLDMTQEQKDAAYDILYEQAEESVSKQSPGNDVFAAVTSSFGFEMDAEDLGLDFAIEDELTQDIQNGETPDTAQVMATMKERQQQRINEKVEALRPVLNDTQLQQYRSDLESRSQSIFGGAFNELTIEAE